MNRIRVTGERLIAPSILLAEVDAAIRRGTDDVVLSQNVLKQLRSSSLIKFLPITQEIAVRAAEIAVAHRIRGCDAVYVAVAEQMRHVLVTLDRQQLERSAAVIRTAIP